MYFTNGTEPKWLLCLLYTWATIDSPKHLCFSQSLSLDPYLEPSLSINLWDPILCKRLHVLCKEIQGIKLIVTRKPILQNSTVLKYISKRQKTVWYQTWSFNPHSYRFILNKISSLCSPGYSSINPGVCKDHPTEN